MPILLLNCRIHYKVVFTKHYTHYTIVGNNETYIKQLTPPTF